MSRHRLPRPAARAAGSGRRFALVLVVLVIALALAITAAVTIGPVALAPGLVWRIAFDRLLPGVLVPNWQAFQATIVWQIRLPRVLLGGIVGAGLAVVGVTLQAMVRNPLADPYLLGTSSGAAFGAVAVLVLGGVGFGLSSVAAAAFLGALVASAAVYLLAAQTGRLTTARLILSGVAVSAFFSAVTNLIIFRAPSGEQSRSAIFWLLGGLGAARWRALGLPAGVLLVGTIVSVLQARTLNVLSLGEEAAASLGVDAHRARTQGYVLTSLMTGVLVALSGGIGFVGLMVPHIGRLLVGADIRRLLPVAALGGAIFLIVADVLARIVDAPQELPIGIVTALVGAPFFLWLMRRERTRAAS